MADKSETIAINIYFSEQRSKFIGIYQDCD